MPKALKSCPKSKILPNLVTLSTRNLGFAFCSEVSQIEAGFEATNVKWNVICDAERDVK